MEKLPNDVLVDILSRLGVRQLCQLKCVSKQWRKLISDAHFRESHSRRWMRHPRLLIVKESTEGHPALFGQPLSRTLYICTMDISTGDIRMEFTKDIVGRHYCYILSNNLICFEKFMALAVCNPTTREIGHLPLPSRPSIGYNLGYHKPNNHYKIIHFFTNSNPHRLGFEILTLEDGGPLPQTWRKLKNHTTTSTYNIWHNYNTQIDSLSMNGAIYWLVNNAKGDSKKFICFDLEKEQFTNIYCPQDYAEINHGKGDREQLVDLQGFLCLAHYSKQSSSVAMYVLKDHASQIWVKELIIDLCNTHHHDFRIIGSYSTCGDDDQSGAGEMIIIMPPAGRPLFYDMKSRSFRKINGQNIDKWIGCYKNLHFDRFFFLGKR